MSLVRKLNWAANFLAAVIFLHLATTSIVGASADTLGPCVVARIERGLIGPSSDERQVLASTSGNLFSLTPVSPEVALERNEQVLQSLYDLPIPAGLAASRNAAFSQSDITRLYDRVISNDQVTEGLCGTYRGSINYGFCFGRAFIAHMLALSSGISRQSVRKLWAVGPLRSGSTSWRYHVTTIVRTTDGDWVAIDPIFGKPMSVFEWVDTMKQEYDPTGTMRIYSSEASRAGVESDRRWSKQTLLHESYYGFFTDFLDQFTRDNGSPPAWAAARSEQAKIRFVKNNATLLKIAPIGAAAATLIATAIAAPPVLKKVKPFRADLSDCDEKALAGVKKLLTDDPNCKDRPAEITRRRYSPAENTVIYTITTHCIGGDYSLDHEYDTLCRLQ